MDRITGNTVDIGGGRRGFRNRNLALGLAGTVHNAEYHNPLQEELLALIEGAGLTPDAANWSQVLAGLRQMFAGGLQIFTASGTFVVPAGVTRVKARVWGAGGGGGGSSSTANSVAAAGGGGGFALGNYTVTPGASITVTVGAGGSAGTAGASPGNGGGGGASSFGAFCTANGGGGGLAADGGAQASVGAGGTASGGALNVSGRSGGAGFNVGTGFILSQGGAPFGGQYTPTAIAGAAFAGIAGIFPGGGASGGILGAAGGAGGGGLVILEW